MSSYDKTDRNAYIALGALLGLAGGVFAGMLTAPRSGRESREQIRTKWQETKQHAAEEAERKKRMALEHVDQASGKAKELVDKGQENLQRSRRKNSDDGM